MLKVTTLPSGLKVATYKVSRQVSAIEVKIRAGYRFENSSNAGLGHFLEHLLFEGTNKFPTPQLLRDSIRSLGGHIHATTGYDEISYFGDILIENLTQLVDTLSQQLQYSLLDHKAIEKEKNIVLQEMHKRRDDNEIYLRGHLVNESLWADQPLSHTLEREIANLENINVDSIKKYLRDFYVSSNMVVCIAGDIDHEKWVSKIAEAFSNLHEGTPAKFTPAINKLGRNVRLITQPVKQVKLSLGFYGPIRSDPLFHPTQILDDILNQRLFYKLIYGLGLAYKSYCDFSNYLDTGKIELGGGFAPGKTREFIEAILAEVENIKTRQPTEKELSDAKARRKSSIIYTNESVLGLASSYARRIIRDIDPILLEDELKLIESVTSKQVQISANKFLTSDYKIAAIAPEEDIKELEKLYGQSNQKASDSETT